MLLVTGGAGFIGSVLAAELNRAGVKDLLIVDRLEDSTKWLNIRDIQFQQFIHADDLFLPEHDPWLRGVSGIFHMGACSTTTETNMDYLMANNVEYSKALYELATVLNVPFIYASSAATYGDGKRGYSDDHTVLDNYQPMNRYGYSKHLFDQWVLRQEKAPPLWAGIKFFNVYGPNEYHKDGMRSVVHQAYEQIRDIEKVRLFKSYREGIADGEQKRDFVYVKDVVDAMIQMFRDVGKIPSGIYNMGTGKAQSFLDLANATFKAMDITPNIEFIDMPAGLDKQYQYFTEAEMGKFKSVYPDFEFSDLEKGVDDYVKNFLLQDHPYDGFRK